MISISILTAVVLILGTTALVLKWILGTVSYSLGFLRDEIVGRAYASTSGDLDLKLRGHDNVVMNNELFSHSRLDMALLNNSAATPLPLRIRFPSSERRISGWDISSVLPIATASTWLTSWAECTVFSSEESA